MYKFSLIAVLLFSVLVIGCSTSHTLKNVQESLPPDRLDGRAQTAKTVRQGIMAGCIEKGWSCRKIGKGLIEASLTLRHHFAVALISYNADSYDITYKSSENLDYNRKRNTIHRSYNRWVNNLDNAIRKWLAVGTNRQELKAARKRA
ncbi:MAG: hypothetical protein K0U59_07895 [Gammaproteobacteria bacterium]|nr:hypothetical protein [Gammaproteobacteria bacterium]